MRFGIPCDTSQARPMLTATPKKLSPMDETACVDAREDSRQTELPHVEFAGINHVFHNRSGRPTQTIDNVSISIPRGQFVAMVGPSGCGKTTLLNMVAGLIRPSSGAVRVADEEVVEPRRDVGYMCARDGLLPWRVARDNVALGLEIRGVMKRERAAKASKLLELVGLGQFQDAYRSQLSQGMRQRVAIARTLAVDPDLFLLDEPFAALDAQTKMAIQNEFIAVWESRKTTVVLVTHDIAEAVLMADRVLVFSHRPARIKRDLHIDIPRPRDPDRLRFTPQFASLTELLWSDLKTEMEVTE